jgi:hypothetical protein
MGAREEILKRIFVVNSAINSYEFEHDSLLRSVPGVCHSYTIPNHRAVAIGLMKSAFKNGQFQIFNDELENTKEATTYGLKHAIYSCY